MAPLHKIELWHGCPLHHVKYKWFIPAFRVDSNFQVSIPAKSVCMASHVKLPVQNMNFRPSPPPNPGKMPIRVDALAFELFVLNHRSHVPNSSLFSKYTGKEGDRKSNNSRNR